MSEVPYEEEQEWRAVAEAEEEDAAVLVAASVEEVFPDAEIVVLGGRNIVAFADDEAAARELANALAYAGAEVLESAVRIERWSELDEEWLPPNLPQDDESFEWEEIDLSAVRFEVRAKLPSREVSKRIARDLDRRGFPYVRQGRRLSVGIEDRRQAATVSDFIVMGSPSPVAVDVRPFTRLGRWHFQIRASGSYWPIEESGP